MGVSVSGASVHRDPIEGVKTMEHHLLVTHKIKKGQVTLYFVTVFSLGQEYDWRNYQPNPMSESELQMLASLRRQQNEELEDTGASHGLSASQVDNCNVSISTSSDDTTTWNSCLPPVSPGFCVFVYFLKQGAHVYL